MTAPRYRNDIKGNVAAVKADFLHQCKSEIQCADEFIILVEDTSAYQEYRDLLTESEMKSLFKKALAN